MAFFGYSKQDFELLTPVQADLIIHQRTKLDEARYNFLQNEFRTSNFFSIKSSMGDTKKIRKPSDLYSLPVDLKEKAFSRKQIEFFDRKLTEEEIRLFKSL